MVKNPAEKVLYAEENAQTVNDGLWVLSISNNDRLAVRHDLKRAVTDTTGRGNVSFCDGHGEYADRSYVHDPLHYLPDK